MGINLPTLLAFTGALTLASPRAGQEQLSPEPFLDTRTKISSLVTDVPDEKKTHQDPANINERIPLAIFRRGEDTEDAPPFKKGKKNRHFKHTARLDAASNFPSNSATSITGNDQKLKHQRGPYFPGAC